MRKATHTALAALAMLCALAPDLHAQRGGGRRGGGGRGGASGALFGAQRGARGGAGATFGAQRGRGKGAANAAPLGAKPQPAPPTTAPKAAALQADEQRFRRFLSDIDKKIAAADEGHAATDEQLDALGFDLPAGVEPGSVEWRNLQRPIFQTCDYDGGGWLSFRELQASIAIDRDEFFAYDRDRDGRVGPREFTARYDDVVAKSGAFRLPKPKDAGGRIEPRSAAQLRGAFDSDARALRRGRSIETIHASSYIDSWFLAKIKNLVDMEIWLTGVNDGFVQRLREAKQMGFPDRVIAGLAGVRVDDVALARKAMGIKPSYKTVDTCAAEFEAHTPYFYSSQDSEDELLRD